MRARNGDVELYYESFGDERDPTLLLVNGLGGQCISFTEEWCSRFVAHGYRVIRFDNRDAGLSTKVPDVEYTLWDMADDAVAVLDAAGVDRAHVLGVSMGGMIVQSLAIARPERVVSLTSVMSHTGEVEYGRASPAALAFLTAPPPTTRDEYVERRIASIDIIGSRRDLVDVDEVRALGEALFDRCFCPDGQARQLEAVNRSGTRGELLPLVTAPTLVLHGSRDTLVDPSGGRRTAELIPGARFVEIEDMRHDSPRASADRWI